MGIFDVFGKKDEAPAASVPAADEEGFAASASRLVTRLLDIGVDGRGRFDSARTVADNARRRRSDPERAIDDIVGDHLKLAAAGGFVTGLGGFVTLPVALPANVAGFYIIATRMAAAIAAVRGYDLASPGVRSALLLALVGSDAENVLRKVGYGHSGPLAGLATRQLPGPVLMAVNKGVGFRLLTQFGRKALGRFGRAVPFLGGVIGAGIDSVLLRGIATYVRREFPANPPPAISA